MYRVLEFVERVARVDAAVLITGESGSGKELVARALHHYSLRASRSWIDVNCAALPEHLIESELFGHEKGAFSGATSAKPGLFELADKGTLFLDEIGELEPRMQVKMLRVLDGVPYYRLGAVRKVSVNVRVIAATNHNLGKAVKMGQFRTDLYHRLSQLQIDVPPLRERKQDILPLAEYFLRQHKPDCELSKEARQSLEDYHWPGNVRELRNVALKVSVLARNPVVRNSDLPEFVQVNQFGGNGASLGHGGVSGTSRGAGMTLDGVERQAILQVLEKTDGHQQRAADLLGISRRTLSRKLKLYSTQADVETLQTEHA